MAVFEFMEGRLNPGRRHSAVGYTSDVNHEMSRLKTLESTNPIPAKLGEVQITNCAKR